MSDFDNIDIMIGNGSINPIERELAKTIGESTVDYIESNPHPRENPSQRNEFRKFSHENSIPRQHGILESIDTFPNELNLRLKQKSKNKNLKAGL